GQFVLDDINARLFQSGGLISAAVCSDVNGDGWPDLILAPEWGSLKLFLNDHGRLRDASTEWGLDRVVGRWNGVTTGDLDGDGRLDIVATSWGRNTSHHVDPAHPLLLYYGGFTASGRVDMIEAQYDDRVHGIAPLTPLRRLMTTLPWLRPGTRAFTTYANATLQDVLGHGLEVVGRGAGTLAPVRGKVSGITVYGDQRGAAFADYDGDGRLDLAISQNGAETKLYHNEHARPGVRVRLVGGAANPHAIGALLRIVYEGSRGPAREVHGGSGYWSEDGAIQVLGVEADKRPVAVWVRWPGGRETQVPLEAGAREVIARAPR